MTEHQKIINRARKVLALVSSPVEGEAKAASEMLNKILVQHNLSLNEIGSQNNNFHRIAKAATVNKNSTSYHRVWDNTEIADVDNNEFIEVIYRSPYLGMSTWTEDMVVKIAMVYGVKCIQSDYIKLIGYAYDVEIVKTMIISLRVFIESQLSRHGYTDKEYITSYAAGLIDKVVGNMMSSQKNMPFTRARKLYEYLYRHYGFNPRPTFKDVYHVCSAYQVGFYDGDTYNFKKVA